MTTTAIRSDIADALAAVPGTDWPTGAAAVLAAMGYRSELILEGQTGSPSDFIQQFCADNPGTQTEQRFLDAARSAQLIFQITDSEIADAAVPSQRMMFDADGFDSGNAQSFLFFAVELRDDSYSRGRYAEFTREINKRLAAPAVVLFRTASNRVTLAFVHRRPNKRDPERDVLGSVSLIREIDAANPHRAHLDILAELSLNSRLRWMDDHGKSRNFDGLLEAWLDALDTEELNRRFYRDLKDWFDRAVKEARFPATGPRVLKPEEHVIRLITRILFVWFIKEKDLVADDLFVENRIASLLEDYDRAEGDSYYRAVLQNLFFATLNTEISRRSFSSQTNSTHRDFSRYRYAREIADPDALLSLFGKTPFINGGLFDCLDSEEAPRPDGGYRIDYFSDNVVRKGTEEYGKLSIPNRLFFDSGGLITLFNRYKFTVEENTPAEQEVALDPELLGKVFENLLAAYNPETRESARKQTGSYYTPRAVVDYMVDEALVASIVQKISPGDGDRQWWEERLHYLLDYNDAGDLFPAEEAAQVIRAIAELKVLDPAVGSGAFPMSVLHKLTLALRRLDPENVLWRKLQEEIHGGQASDAFRKEEEEQQRARILEDINANFERYKGSDYGRKLYLIQNSIYGVDIQPVATQIAKLRFFISLAIEQQPDPSAENYGIQPLPNLETRFVAANTLLGLDKKALQIPLGGQNRVTELNDQLRENRERHFHAGVRQEKLRLRAEDRRLRADLAKELEKAGMSKSDSGKITSWDPYDQNAHAEWFDVGYMFDIRDGFDVVIGNPPYVSHDKIDQTTKDALRKSYKSYQGFADLYCYFMELSSSLTKRGGVSALITSNSYLKADYGAPIRSYMCRNMALLQVLNIEGSQVFDNVIVNVSITLARNTTTPTNELCIVSSAPLSSRDFRVFIDENSFATSQSYFDRTAWNLVPTEVLNIQRKIQSTGKTLEQLGTKIRLGIATGSNRAFIIDEAQRRAFLDKSPRNETLIKPILRGRDIDRYQYTLPGLYILLTRNGVDVKRDYPDIYDHLDSFGPNFRNRGAKGKHWTNLRACSFFDDFKGDKIVWIELTDTGRFALSNEEVYLLNSAYFLLPPSGINARFLLGILNSSAICFYLNQIAGTSGMGTNRWINNYVKEFPIPQVSEKEQTPLIRLVDRILVAKAADPNADTSELEEEIDWLVYDLYGLTNEETAVIDDFFWKGTLTEEEEDEALLRAMLEVSIDGPDNFVSEADVMATLRSVRDSHGS